MGTKSCTDCRRSRSSNGAIRCEEARSSTFGGVIVLDVEQAKRVATFERICMLVCARCAFYQSVS